MSLDANPLRGYPLRLLVILALINFINFADRTVILPVFPLLRQEFGLSDQQLGELQTVLQIILSLATIPLGFWADRRSRTRIIAAGVVFWSLATLLTGAAQTFMMLLLARALVGVGEAAYGPAAQSMISGAFSVASRARAQAVFAAGMLLGGTAGQALGGIMGESYGWRLPFLTVALPGLLLGAIVFRLQEPPRPPVTETVPFLKLLRVPAYAAMIVSGTLITFAGISLLTWGPDYIVRYKGFSLREAGVSLGAAGLFALVLGVLAGGTVADWAQKRWSYGRVITVAAGFLLAAPFLVAALHAEEKSQVLGAFFIASFFMAWYHGPVTAIIHDMIPERAHATSVALYMFATQLVGAFGPRMVGNISDAHSLRAGLELVVAVMVAGALSFFVVAYFIRRHGLRHPSLAAFHSES